MRQRCNRRLLFHLVDEVLGEIIHKKSTNWPHVRSRSGMLMEGWELAEEVKERIEEFPRANCQVLEDIDALIDRDLRIKWKFGIWRSMGEEIMEGIVKMVEIHILDSLLRETASTICRYAGRSESNL